MAARNTKIVDAMYEKFRHDRNLDADNHDTPIYIPPVKQSPWKRLAYLLPTLFALAILLLVAMSFHVTSDTRSAIVGNNPPSAFETAFDRDAYHIETFHVRDGWDDIERSDLWGPGNLIPENSGFVINRFANGSIDVQNSGAVTVFHQLHCLDMLRMALLMVDWPSVQKGGQPKLMPPQKGLFYGKDKPEQPQLGGEVDHALTHIGHCFDYLVQGIKCNADWTLERLISEKVTDGWNVQHKCRDFEGMKTYGEARGLWKIPAEWWT